MLWAATCASGTQGRAGCLGKMKGSRISPQTSPAWDMKIRSSCYNDSESPSCRVLDIQILTRLPQAPSIFRDPQEGLTCSLDLSLCLSIASGRWHYSKPLVFFNSASSLQCLFGGFSSHLNSPCPSSIQEVTQASPLLLEELTRTNPPQGSWPHLTYQALQQSPRGVSWPLLTSELSTPLYLSPRQTMISLSQSKLLTKSQWRTSCSLKEKAHT